MALNKLLLVFTFAVLSVIADHEWISSEIIHEIYEVQIDGSILFDNTTDDSMHGYVNVTDIPLLDASKNETLNSFRLFEENEFKNIEVVKGSNFNYKKCSVIEKAVDYFDYALFGLVAYLREKVNIIPSIAYAVEALPAEVKIKEANGIYNNYLNERGCSGDWQQYFLGSQLGGIVSTDCISNEATNLPGYDEVTSTLPPKPTKCDDLTTDVEAYAKGFKYGFIYEATADLLKQFLTRVGPVIGDDGIFIGWDESGWILAVRNITDSEQYGKVTYYTEETITYDTDTLFNGQVFYYDCRYPTAETPASVCPCPQDATALASDPRKESICQEQVGPDPEICTAKDTPSATCTCPEVASGTYTKDKCEADKAAASIDCTKDIKADTPEAVCPCPKDKKSQEYKDDPRTKKGLACASGSVRMTLGLIAAAVIIPVLALFA